MAIVIGSALRITAGGAATGATGASQTFTIDDLDVDPFKIQSDGAPLGKVRTINEGVGATGDIYIVDTDADGDFSDETATTVTEISRYDGTITFADGSTLTNNGESASEIALYTLSDGTQYLGFSDAITNDINAQPTGIVSIDLGAFQDRYDGKVSQGNYSNTLTNTIVCFCNGTLIDTSNGPMAVENLQKGMLVETSDGTFKPLRLVCGRQMTPLDLKDDKLRPVRITAGALGEGLPKADLLVSRQHRMLITSPVARRMFGQDDVLISAIRLTELPGIFVDHDAKDVSYFHLVFDEHEVVFANGAPSESFLAGPVALMALSTEARQEIIAIFPEMAGRDYAATSAKFIPGRKRQKTLVARMKKNNRLCLEPTAAA